MGQNPQFWLHVHPPFIHTFAEFVKEVSHDINAQNATELAPGQSICQNRAYGKIMGQNVTVISSGINAQSSALCTLEVLSCASHIKDFIYQGTSGFSAAVSPC